MHTLPKPDHHDAEILLRLYELRREEKLRAARDWFLREFQAETFDELMKRYPYGTQENAYFRMVTGYWEMVASLLNHGLIHEELLFENTGELWAVWEKIKKYVPASRQAFKNPKALENLERAAQKYEEWMNHRAPEALAARRELTNAHLAKKER